MYLYNIFLAEPTLAFYGFCTAYIVIVLKGWNIDVLTYLTEQIKLKKQLRASKSQEDPQDDE